MMDNYQQYIAMSRYARWLPEEGRRETWKETVARLEDFWDARLPEGVDEEVLMEVFESVENLEVTPSMRSLMTAGKALDRDNVAGFNCAYLAMDDVRGFDELMYILLCGTGVGFSVERKYTEQLPEVPHGITRDRDQTIVVPDSKVGWAKSLRCLVNHLYNGIWPTWDTSGVRPSGAPLKTFGGRASGPEPLEGLFKFTCEVFQGAEGRRLSDIEVHDICCKIGEAVVVGGVRRSAMISLSNPTSSRMRGAKSGQWWSENPQRALSNNSACYTNKPDFEFFMDEMRALYESKSGERGFFSRVASDNIATRNGRREGGQEWGTNPCSEIILRPQQFCNLSEVVIRPNDSLAALKDKVRKATILGTLQASLTDFRYLRKVWQDNTKEEALLGVSFTGIYDHEVMATPGPRLTRWLRELKEVSIETNKEWAEVLGINPAAAITCVKPSGTVSQLVDCASGIHSRHAPYYIRRVRGDSKDPLSQFLSDQGVPTEADVVTSGTVVHSFPIRAPEGTTTSEEVGALTQLKLWKEYQDHWCEHKPSITVSYTDEDFLGCAQWLWENFDEVSGVSFLPKSEHSYQQAPYEAIGKPVYDKLLKAMPELNWDEFVEQGDTTEGSQTMACVGNSCELI